MKGGCIWKGEIGRKNTESLDTMHSHVPFSTVLQFRVDDVMVNEGEGTALVVVELLNNIEREVVLEYNTGEVAGGATGM